MGIWDWNAGIVRARKPWASSGRSYQKPHDEREIKAHYRGWTMVERTNARYAVRGTSARRVCELHIPIGDALKMFHRLVDRMEDAEC